MDIFEQLAELEVPPPPVEFDRALHERLNRTLMAMQVTDLFLRALPFAACEFARGVFGFLCYTIAGTFPEDRKKR